MKTCKFDIKTRLVTRDKMTVLTTNCMSFVFCPDCILQKVNKVIFDWSQQIRKQHMIKDYFLSKTITEST